MKVRLHKFTPEGLDLASEVLDSVRRGESSSFAELLERPRYSYPFHPYVDVEIRDFPTRREVGASLSASFSDAGVDDRSIIEDHDTWSWLAMRCIAPKNGGDKVDLGQTANMAYVFDPKREAGQNLARAKWRNFMRLSYEIYARHGEGAWLMLNERPRSLSQFTMRIAQAQILFRATGIVHLVHMLYADRSTGRLKPNSMAQQRSTATPGSLPRLIDVLNQLYMNYDVYGMEAERLIELLPSEFDKFRQ